MSFSDFLGAVLPSTGLYAVCELTSPRRQHAFVDNIAEVSEWADAFNARGYDTYFALASYKEAGSREAVNVQAMRSLFVDIDLKAKGQTLYATKKEAAAALAAFLANTQLDRLGSPWLVDSGGGLHAYWPLDEDAPVAVWKPVAEALKRAAKSHGFKIDMTCTADPARVLRMPGTDNHKFTPPRPAVLKLRGDIFSLQDIADKLPVTALPAAPAQTALTLPGQRPALAVVSPTAKALANDSVTKFKVIMMRTAEGTGCAQLQHYIDNAADDGMEPLWRGWLSIAEKCEDGWKAAVKLSALHPYDSDRLQRKWSEIRGPYPCTKFDSENPGLCTGCRHWGKITNPLALGREYAQVQEVHVEPEHEDEEAPTIPLPTPPRGYAFMQNSVRREVVDADGTQYVPILPYILYLDAMYQEDAAYYARFCQVLSGKVKFIALPTRALASKDETIKLLSQQYVMAAFGSGNDKHLYEYVRAAVQEHSVNDDVFHIPPKYGWQPDDSFAYADRVVGAGRNYAFVSEKLGNLMQSMQPQGELVKWRSVVEMLAARGNYDVMSLGLIGLASPLMRWCNNGADAMVFHACSRASGVGKSLALGIARSTWGNARFSVVPNTSETTMLQRAGFLGGLPLLVDEVTVKNREKEMEWIPNFVFNYSQASHKLKGSGSANAELNNNSTWSALALITSNSPVLEYMVGARTTSSDGEVMRMLEWRSETQLQFSDHERSLLRLLNENYGVAGPAFAEWLVQNSATAARVMQSVVRRWSDEIGATDSERYWVAGGAALIAAAILAGPRHANICTVDARQVMEFIKSLVQNARDLCKENVRSAQDLFSAFIAEHNGQFIKVGYANAQAAALAASGGVNNVVVERPDSARGKVFGRIELNVNPGVVDTYIELAALKRFCAVRNWSYMAFRRDMAAHAVVRETAMNLFSGTAMASGNTRCLQITQPTGKAIAAQAQD